MKRYSRFLKREIRTVYLNRARKLNRRCVKTDPKPRSGVNFINVKRANFLHECHFVSLFLVTCT